MVFDAVMAAPYTVMVSYLTNSSSPTVYFARCVSAVFRPFCVWSFFVWIEFESPAKCSTKKQWPMRSFSIPTKCCCFVHRSLFSRLVEASAAPSSVICLSTNHVRPKIVDIVKTRCCFIRSYLFSIRCPAYLPQYANDRRRCMWQDYR